MTAKPDIPALTQPRLYKGAVVSVEEIAEDTRIFRVEVMKGERPDYLPGQYAMVHAEGFEPRAFSIASAPHAGYLEFHIKSTGRGISAHIFDTWKKGGAVALEAPFGGHYWRASSRPLLALAGGVGIAPLKAIIDAQLAHKAHAPAHLYWGVRDRTHLYLDKYFRMLEKECSTFHYVPLLAQGENTAPYRSGYIAPAVAHDFTTLAGFNIYLAGPAAMIEATLPALLAKNAEKDSIFSDAFGP